MPTHHQRSYRCKGDFSELTECAEPDFQPENFGLKAGSRNLCHQTSLGAVAIFDPKVRDQNLCGHTSSEQTAQVENFCVHRSFGNRTLDPKVKNPQGFRAKAQGKMHFHDFDGIDDFRTLKSHFVSSQAAAEAGYFSKSVWKSKGRIVKDGATPVLCVAKTWKTSSPIDSDIILSLNMMNHYEVTSRRFCPETRSPCCWDVFPKSETVLISKDKQKQISEDDSKEQNQPSTAIKSTSPITNSSSSSSSSSFLPYDGETTIEKAKRDGKKQCKTPSSGGSRSSRTNKKRKPQSSRFIYFPEDFQWTPELERFRSTFMWFAHTLYQRRFVNTDGRVYGKDEFVTVKSEYARKVSPKFRQMIEVLLAGDNPIIERDHYQVGVKSYGYRFADPALRQMKRVRMPLEDPDIVKRLNEHAKKQATTRNDRWLRSQLFKIGLSEVDPDFLHMVARRSVVENDGKVEDKLEAYRYVLERIANREHNWKPDHQGRRYTLITNLKRELRSLLRVEGRQLQFIDINNSQLTFLALEMKRQGVECGNFTRYCEEGQLYEHIAKHAKTSRSAVKLAITQKALFSPNGDRCQRKPIKQTFDRLFPEAARFIHEQKDHEDGHSEFAKMLQRAEADLIINRVCGKLRRDSDVRFVTPVHDCLLFLPEDAATIKAVMEAEFDKIGLKPRLEVKDLAADT